MSQALVLRRTADGLRVVGEAPEDHVVTSALVARERALGVASVRLELETTEGPLVYDLTGPELVDDDPEHPNFSAWRARLVEGGE